MTHTNKSYTWLIQINHTYDSYTWLLHLIHMTYVCIHSYTYTWTKRFWHTHVYACVYSCVRVFSCNIHVHMKIFMWTCISSSNRKVANCQTLSIMYLHTYTLSTHMYIFMWTCISSSNRKVAKCQTLSMHGIMSSCFFMWACIREIWCAIERAHTCVHYVHVYVQFGVRVHTHVGMRCRHMCVYIHVYM